MEEEREEWPWGWRDLVVGWRRRGSLQALCLSGGGALSMYHMGVVRCMLEQQCLPSVVSGTSGGSIVAAFMAIHTDSELLALISPKVGSV